MPRSLKPALVELHFKTTKNELSLVVSMVMSFCAVLFPTSVLDEILNLIESVSEEFPSYS